MTKDALFLLEYLEDIIYKGGDGNFLIINFGGDYYIQCICDRGAYKIQCEAVGNMYLNEETKLNSHQKEQLLKLGWEEPYHGADGGNYSVYWPVDSEIKREKLLEYIFITAHKVYGAHEILEKEIILNLV